VAVSGVTRPLFGRRGLADGAIVHQWATIVGEHLARWTAPEAIRYPRHRDPKGRRTDGTLDVRVANGGTALELQHLEPLVIERINTHLGFSAVARLRLVNGPLPRRGPPPVPASRPLSPEMRTALDRQLKTVGDPELRAVLGGLGSAILGDE